MPKRLLSDEHIELIMSAHPDDWDSVKKSLPEQTQKGNVNILRVRKGLPPFVNAKQKYYYNESFFLEKSLRSCYWAGFIAADGWITYPKHGQKVVGIRLKDSDRKHIETFSTDINGGYICEGSQPAESYGGSRCRYVQILANNDRLVEGLEGNFNITQRKSLTLEPPSNLNEDQKVAFAAGYIDGDGSYTWHKLSKGRAPALTVYGSLSMVTWIAETLGFSHNKVTPNGNIHMSSCYGEDAKKSREKIFSVQEEIPLLERKYKRWEHQLGIDMEIW